MNHILPFLFLCLLLLPLFPALARGEVQKNVYLDTTLSMLEEDNPFLKRYGAITGEAIQARFPLGCPYFWGGRDVGKILQPSHPWQSTSDYYEMALPYLYGLDCVGLTRFAVTEAGYTKHPSISDMVNTKMYQQYALPETEGKSGAALSGLLEPGDLLAIRHYGGYHVAMYIGTLRDFGYTEEDLSESLRPYLLYPLIINNTVSADYYLRYERYLEDTYEYHVYPPDGGTVVSILDVDTKDADGTALTPLSGEQPYFLLDGYHLQTYDTSKDQSFRWLRWREPAQNSVSRPQATPAATQTAAAQASATPAPNAQETDEGTAVESSEDSFIEIMVSVP